MSKLFRILFNEEGGEGGGQPAEPEKVETPSVEELQKEVEKYKNEAKDAFEKRDTIKKERDELKGKFQAMDDEEKIKSGKTSELLADKEKALAEAQAKLDEANESKTKYDELVQGIKDDLIDQLPDDDHKEIAKGLELEALRKYVKLHSKKDAAGHDNGNPLSGDGGKLTDADRKKMAEMGITDEKAYRRYLETKEKLKT